MARIKSSARKIKELRFDLDKFAKQVGIDQVDVVRKLAFDTFGALILKSPVDTGYFRGNWHISLDQPTGGKLFGTKGDNVGGSSASAAATSQGSGELASLQPYQSVWLQNNVDYGQYLEQGSSSQAPQGMVAVTLAELRVKLGQFVKVIETRRVR